MNSRWFKEERKLPKAQQAKAIAEAKEVLGHSTTMSEKLKRIIEEDIEQLYAGDENVGQEGWEQRALANVGGRKALRKLLEILP